MTRGYKAIPPIERFWPKVDKNGDCWEWLARKSPDGYGIFTLDGHGKKVRAHRFAYELLVGPIPEGLTLDHLCRNRACVNPAHLEPVTVRENTLRGRSFSAIHARKTHCKHGHEFTPENTRIEKTGGRACRKCANRARTLRRAAARATPSSELSGGRCRETTP